MTRIDIYLDHVHDDYQFTVDGGDPIKYRTAEKCKAFALDWLWAGEFQIFQTDVFKDRTFRNHYQINTKNILDECFV